MISLIQMYSVVFIISRITELGQGSLLVNISVVISFDSRHDFFGFRNELSILMSFDCDDNWDNWDNWAWGSSKDVVGLNASPV